MDMFDTVKAAERGAWLHLVNIATERSAYLPDENGEDDESKPCRIKLLGMDSPAVRKAVRFRAAKLLKARGKSMDVSKMSEAQLVGLLVDGEEGKAHDAADATIGWENLTKDGKPLEYSDENAIWLYTTYPAILRQVAEFLENDANFFTKA